MYEFLTSDWIEAARDIRERHRADSPEIPVAVTINLNVSDAPEVVTDAEFYLDTTDGTMVLEAGAVEQPDVIIATDYALVRSLVLEGDGQAFMQAFLEGRVQLQGDMAKLMMLQASMAQLGDPEVAAEVAAELRAITKPT